MFFVNRTTGDDVGLEQIRREYPNSSFPQAPTSEDLADTDYAVVVDDGEPNYDQSTEKVIADVEQVDGVWRVVYSVVALTSEELAERADAAWDSARYERVPKLLIADHLVNKAQDAGDADAEAAARAYRQALRDITNQADPANVVWPTKPA